MSSTNDILYQEIGELVRSARKRARLTQDELAERAGLTRTSITNVEAGNQQLRVHTLINISDALGVSPMSLLPLSNSAANVETRLEKEDLRKV